MEAKLIKVAPFSGGSAKELSYFSFKNVEKGALVKIKLSFREIPALVLEAEPIEKSKIRLLPYALKRITSVEAPDLFTDEFINAARKTAEYFLCGAGSVIKEFCPQAILKNPPQTHLKKISGANSGETPPAPVFALQKPRKERIKFYKNLVRTGFANNQSLFLCLPARHKIRQYEEELKKGIEHRVLTLHSEMTEKIIREKWSAAAEEKQPMLIIATGLFLSLPKQNLKTIIIDEESSPFYKSRKRPFLDIRTFAEELCRETKSSLIFADEILRLETRKRIEKNEVATISPISAKTTSRAKETLVDITKNKTLLSAELKEVIKESAGQNEQILLFINRRGYELSTICNDCGRVISCIRCDTPLVLHKKQEKEFLCHKCFLKIKAVDRCPHCKSWRLKSLGFGIQKFQEEIQNTFPEIKIFRLDSDSVKTKKQGFKLIDDYLNSPGSILIATEMLFSFYESGFDRIGIITVDGLFSIPDFAINEKVFRLLLKLKSGARKIFLIQTRMIEHPVFLNLLRGDMLGFFNSELLTREKFGYPPFKTLLKIGREIKNKEKSETEIKLLEEKLAKYNPISFTAFTPKIKNTHRFYLLLKIDAGTWPRKQKELHELLLSFSPKWTVEVAPESLV